jgi:hypothetical protein
LARHDVWAAAQALGAAEIHLLIVPDTAQRVMIEQDIIKAQMPILNRMAKPPRTA